MRKIFYLLMIIFLFVISACTAPEPQPTEEPVEVATEEPVMTEEATEEMEEEMAVDTSICGTDEEVTITYIGDPAGSHPDAEKANH